MNQDMGKDFLDHLQSLYIERNETAVDRIKTSSWKRFCAEGLPTRQKAGYRHMRLRDLYAQKPRLTTATKQIAEESALHFVNGSYIESKHVPKQCIIMPLSKALKTFGSYLQTRFEKQASFAALNAALFQEGLFIYVPPKCVLDAPLHIVHHYEGDTPFSLVAPRIHVFAGAESKCAIFLSDVNGKTSTWNNSVIDLYLEKSASIDLSVMTFQNEETFHTEAITAHLQSESSLNVFALMDGAKAARKDFHVTLEGEKANASLKGLWLVQSKREVHVNVFMDHAAPHTYSSQQFKGALTDFGKSSFEGKIFVRENALKTEAFQANHNLILSEKALCYTQPNLEIFADDVKASHGATCGTLNKEHLFYLKTRGMEEGQAKKLLVAGFMNEMIEAIPSLEMQSCAKKRFSQDVLI